MICCIEAPFTLTGEENTQLAQSRVGRVDGRNRREQSNQKVNKKRQNGGRTQFDVIFSPLARYLRLLFRHETTGSLQQQLKTIILLGEIVFFCCHGHSGESMCSLQHFGWNLRTVSVQF